MLDGMSKDAGRVAVVTGANQGLGFALVESLCRAFGPGDTVYLTARDDGRGAEAVGRLRAAGHSPTFARVDVCDPASVAQFGAMVRGTHGGLDLVLSNATSRMVREVPFAQQVRTFVRTSNLATTLLMRELGPSLRDGGRFLVVASAFGRLRHLPEALRARFDQVDSLDAIDALMLRYVDAVERGVDGAEGWPEWINVPSKVGQVAAMRLYARMRREEAGRRGLVIDAVCPGLVDTGASRPWFADMSKAQTPEAAARDVVWLATAPRADVPYGELVQHRAVLAWRD
jgi:NAD(P)-dependent dehydrogenase (short-subunit alcohol dehydrogenase family)